MQTFKGIARNTQWIPVQIHAVEEHYLLNLRVECIDDKGDINLYIPAELRKKVPTNIVSDGDEIIIVGEFNKDKIFEISNFENLGTSAKTMGSKLVKNSFLGVWTMTLRDFS